MVVGVEDSALGFAAIRYAALQIAARDRPLRLVHAYNWAGSAHNPDAALASSRADLEKLMERAVATAREARSSIKVETVLVEGPALRALTRNAVGAAGIVIGGRSSLCGEGIPWESLTMQVASQAPCPVLVVREEPPPRSGPILVGVDGSYLSELALAWALELAAFHDARIVAMQVRDQEWEEDRASGYRLDDLAEVVARIHPRYPEVRIEQQVVIGEPEVELLEAAQHVQLVVIGPRGSQPSRGLLGGVSQRILYHSPAPVFIVRGRVLEKGGTWRPAPYYVTEAQ